MDLERAGERHGVRKSVESRIACCIYSHFSLEEEWMNGNVDLLVVVLSALEMISPHHLDFS